MAQGINRPGLRVSALTLWETERACVRYTESSENAAA
jgi:6-pyruvoyltetrahydropterin/6-carboxytetrahydropterin synthase